jgi:hypothetical protein
MKGAAEWFEAIIVSVTKRTRFYGFYPFRVTAVSGSTASVAPILPLSAGLDPIPYLSLIPGIPGTTATLAVDSVVLLGFQAGNQGYPFLAFHLSAPLPASVQFDATTDIKIGGASAVALAKAGVVDLNFVAVIAKLNTALSALSLPLMGSVTATGTITAKGA